MGPLLRGQKGERAFEIVLQRRVQQGSQGAEGVAGRGGVGRIGLDENAGPVAPKEIAGEIFRDIYDKLDFATAEHVAPFGFGLHLPDKLK